MSVLPEGSVGSLVEVVLRVRDLDAMRSFYADTLGLRFWRRFGDDMVFFKLPERIGRRPQALALFVDRWPSNIESKRWAGLDPDRTTIHHFALAIDAENLRSIEAALLAAGVSVEERTFPWVGWRSLMLEDPEGNVVELVADDPTMSASVSN